MIGTLLRLALALPLAALLAGGASPVAWAAVSAPEPASKERVAIGGEFPDRWVPGRHAKNEQPEQAKKRTRKPTAQELYDLGVQAQQESKFEIAIKLYEEVSLRFGRDPDVPTNVLLAKALFSKGVALRQSGKIDEAIACYEEVVARFGESPEAEIKEQAAWALFAKGIALGRMKKYEEEIASYNEVLERFGETAEPLIQLPIAESLRNKGIALADLGRTQEGIVSLDELIRRFGKSSESALEEQVARAFHNKGRMLNDLGNVPAAIDSFSEVAWRFGTSRVPAIMDKAALSLNDKYFILLTRLKSQWREKTDEARKAELAVFRDRFEDSIWLYKDIGGSEDLRFPVANLAYTLFLEGKREEAEKTMREAFKLGGEKTYKGEMADAEIHPIPGIDDEFKVMVNRLWDEIKPKE